jgi:thiol-disulfide isomerase/thioredoxin
MHLRLILLLLATALSTWAALVSDVRAAIAKNDFAHAEKLISEFRAGQGTTPEMILAMSWLGRGSLAAKRFDAADNYAIETRKLALAKLKSRKLDDENDLPLALGASIEVQAHVMDARGERTGAVGFLRKELAAWRDTSIRTRIQKNINLLSLEGKPAPPLEMQAHLGPKPTPVSDLKGKPVVLFFWAHWCGDCKRQAPILARIASEFAPKGLVVVGPTQRYGYVAGGIDATPEKETPYIDEVRKQHYAALASMAVPVSEENFKNYGASTTPTLVLIDRKGIVRTYNPGQLSYEALSAKVREITD